MLVHIGAATVLAVNALLDQRQNAAALIRARNSLLWLDTLMNVGWCVALVCGTYIR